MGEVKISVIIPVYNVDKYLAECLDSVFGQDFADFEVICVEDGSTDDSGKILREYAAHHSNMKIFWGQGNHGLSYARNRGLELASGKYVIFVDADDMISANAFCILFDVAEKRQTDILFFDNDICNEEGRIKSNLLRRYDNNLKPYTGREFFREMIEKNEYTPAVWAQFARRVFLIENELGFYEGLLHEDVLYTFLGLMKANRVVGIRERLYIYRKRGGSLSNTIKPIKAHSFLFCVFEILHYWKKNLIELNAIHRAIECHLRYLLRRYYFDEKCIAADAGFEFGSAADKFLYELIKGVRLNLGNEIVFTTDQINIIQSSKHLYIYGAGQTAVAILDAVVSLRGVVTAFLVTDMKFNPAMIDGINVQEITQVVLEPEDLVLIAVAPKHADEVVHNILRQGDCQYFCPV